MTESLQKKLSPIFSRHRFSICFVRTCAVLVLLVWSGPLFPVTGFSSDRLLPQDEKSGQAIYSDQCATCHGPDGLGDSDHYKDPLLGELSLEQLTKLVNDTMPEESPGDCVGVEAERVAKYVFKSFYSAESPGRAGAARVELSRLTVRQYRQSVADLLGAFSKPAVIPSERGLSATYFAARNQTKARLISRQIDPTVDFGGGVPHFDPTGKYESIPTKEKKKNANKMNDGFSVHWNGGLIPPETGTYELIVQSKNGFALRVNDLASPLIDRRVRSDEVVDHRATIYLIAGRMVSLRLEMFSYPDPPAKIRLLWKPPGHPLEVIPEAVLVPRQTPEVAIVSTPFPADDGSSGYARGVLVSSQWDAASTDAAIDIANLVSLRIWKLARTKPGDDDSVKKIKQFCERFVARAFSTQLTDADRQFFVGQHFDQEISIEDQVKRVVLMTLKSPRFLYPVIENRTRSHEVARRMALGFWDSIPDQQLFTMASKGKMTDPALVTSELARLVDDPRSKQKLNSFFEYWLQSGARDATKDKELFPDFNEQLIVDMQTSLNLYLDDVVWSGESDFRQLFLADYLYVNDRLAKFYDLEIGTAESVESGAAGFHKVQVDPKTRAGILTHPYLMTGLAYYQESSPIHRGVFVAKRLLGVRLRQPPSNVEPLTEAFDPTMTVRQRVEYQTKDDACMSCHRVINPLGFSLENFDAVGRFRNQDKQKPIEVASVFRLPDGKQVKLNGPRDLANFLANDVTAQRNFVRQLFQFYVKQPIEAFGDRRLDELHGQFVASDFDIKQLLVDIVQVSVLQGFE